MNKYEVEVEVLYTYAVEAENASVAAVVAQMKLANGVPWLERIICSVYSEEVDEFRAEHYRQPPHGFSQRSIDALDH